MTAEVGKKCIAIPDFESDGYVYQEGCIPEIGETVIAYPLKNGKYVALPLPSVEMGEPLFLDLGAVPWTLPAEVTYLSLDGWSFSYGFYGSHGGYSTINSTSGTSGEIGIYIERNGDGCWSKATKIFHGDFYAIEVEFNVSSTTAPEGKYTRLMLNDYTTVYSEPATASGMGSWYRIQTDFGKVIHNPTLTFVCDCPIALHGEFSLGIRNLYMS